MSKKKLKLGRPYTQTYLYEAYPLSILEANGNDYLPWLLSNYIQVDCFKDVKKDLFLVFHGPLGNGCPYLKVQEILWSNLTKFNLDLELFIKREIEEGYYLYFQVDDFYRSNSIFFNKSHVIHDLLIYGYDDEINCYNYIAYDNDRLFGEDVIEYQMFEKAFYNNNLDKDENAWADKILLYKYNPKGEYKFNLDLVKHSIREYLLGINSFEIYNRFQNKNKDKAYGIEVFQVLKEYINYIDQNISEKREIDLRTLRIIKEKNEIMIERLKYINKKIINIKDIIKRYNNINELTNKCFSLGIEYNISFNKDVLDNIYRSLFEIKEQEESVLQDLLTKLS